MAPPREACQVYSQAALIKARILKKVQEIREIVNKIIDVKAKIKFGIISLADIVGAELLSAISSVASQVAQQALGALSNMAANILNALLEPLLKILLANPTAIFSLVAIQQEQALEKAVSERRFILRARANLRIIIGIIRKWLSDFGGAKYMSQIRRAIPYIEEALQLSADIITELEGEPTKPGEQRNAVFNQGKYNRMRSLIRTAIEITTPKSQLADTTQINNIIEQNAEKIYRERASEIKAEYKELQNQLNLEYQEQMSKIDTTGQSLKNALQQESIRNRYAASKNELETEKKLKLEAAKISANAQAVTDGSAYVKASSGVLGEFSYDSSTLLKNLGELVENTKDAYLNYKASQVLCNSLYNSRNLIRRLIEQIISLIRGIGNSASDLLIKALEGSQSLLEMTWEDFQLIVQRYSDPKDEVGQVEMASTVVKGHGFLIASDALLQSTVTDSLIDLINSDDVLSDANDEFNKWIERIAKINDWDGKENVWAVTPFESATPPYINLVSKTIELLAKAPKLALSNTEKSQDQMRKLLKNVNDSFKTVATHNSIVRSTLSSYKPYMANEAADLKRILGAAGLLEAFAIGMSITSIISSLASMIKKYDLDNVIPTYENCRASYPDLFTDPDLAVTAAQEQVSFPAPEFAINFQSKLESGDASVENVLALRKRIDSTNLDSQITDSDLYDNSEANYS